MFSRNRDMIRIGLGMGVWELLRYPVFDFGHGMGNRNTSIEQLLHLCSVVCTASLNSSPRHLNST